MIVMQYIVRELIKRFCITTLITFVISVSIAATNLIGECVSGCNTGREIVLIIFTAFEFIENSFFFIAIISITWLTVVFSKTNQGIIIAIYSQKKTIIAKALLTTATLMSLLYALIYASFASPYIKNYISIDDHGRGYHIEKAWLSTMSVVNDSTSGSIYLMKDIGKYLDGYSSESLSIYEVKNGYLTSYEKFNKPFLTSSVDGKLMFIYRDANGKISRNIKKDVAIDDIEAEFKREAHQDNIGFVEAILMTLDNKNGRINNEMAKIVTISTIESVIMLFFATTLSLCEFPIYHQRFDRAARGRFSRVILFSIICYASLEILKIVGGATVGSHLASLACCFAFILVFLSRLIKHHH